MLSRILMRYIIINFTPPLFYFFNHTAFGFVFLIYLYFTKNNISILISLSEFCCIWEYAINFFVILIKKYAQHPK